MQPTLRLRGPLTVPMPSRRRRDAGLYFRQPVEIGAQHPPLQDKVCELAIAEDLDQGGGLECLDVMGQGRRANAAPNGVGASCSPISLRI